MLDNLTPFAAEILPGHGADGTLCSTVVIKATLDFEGRAVAQGNAVPVFRGDEFFGAEDPLVWYATRPISLRSSLGWMCCSTAMPTLLVASPLPTSMRVWPWAVKAAS